MRPSGGRRTEQGRRTRTSSGGWLIRAVTKNGLEAVVDDTWTTKIRLRLQVQSKLYKVPKMSGMSQITQSVTSFLGGGGGAESDGMDWLTGGSSNLMKERGDVGRTT